MVWEQSLNQHERSMEVCHNLYNCVTQNPEMPHAVCSWPNWPKLLFWPFPEALMEKIFAPLRGRSAMESLWIRGDLRLDYTRYNSISGFSMGYLKYVRMVSRGLFSVIPWPRLNLQDELWEEPLFSWTEIRSRCGRPGGASHGHGPRWVGRGGQWRLHLCHGW